jgi:hypothetical protein
MPLKYESGDEIRKGDRVLWHGDPGEIEFVADPLVEDPVTEWNLKEFGAGAMVGATTPDTFGRVYQTETEHAEDLVLVSRAAEASSGAKS